MQLSSIYALKELLFAVLNAIILLLGSVKWRGSDSPRTKDFNLRLSGASLRKKILTDALKQGASVLLCLDTVKNTVKNAVENDTVGKMKELAKAGSKFGLERVRALLDALGSPDGRLKIVHIAGTNGKGSTAAYISHILRYAGKRVGTFTSPWVYSYNEQFAVDCQPLESGKLNAYLSEADGAADRLGGTATAFERETAAALYAFLREGCEYAVVECGLGGRDDATNAVNKKEVAVITSVSLEHTAVLGSTITEICRAKSGIIKDCPAVVSALQAEEGRAFFENNLSGKVIFAGEGLKVEKSSQDGQSFSYGGKSYHIRLLGKEQCYNAACAIEACKVLGIDGKAIERGLEETNLAGRVEIITKRNAVYILDGSHNPASFSPLVGVLGGMEGEKTLVYGCLSDKDVRAAAEILSPHFKCAHLVSPDSYRAMRADRIAAAFDGKIKITAEENVGLALEKAGGGIVVVCGSFTLLKEAKQWIEKRQ